MDDRDSISGRVRNFLLFHSVQTGSGTEEALSPEVKRLGREANYLPSSNAEVNIGDIPLLPHTSSWRGA
jgi:hypothetical protein